MKLCRVCRRVKPEEDFYPTPAGNPRDICKQCKTAQVQRNKRRQYGKQFAELGIAMGRNPNGVQNSMRSRILALPYGHPLKNKYFENKKEWADYYRFLERWGRDGAVARPGSSVR